MIASINRRSGKPVVAGPGFPTRVMALIGSSSRSDLKLESEKVDALADLPARPDVVSDLSIVVSEEPLWTRVVAAGFGAATLPIYTARSLNGRIDHRELLDIACQHISSGVGLLTVHPTPTAELVRLARTRSIPCTSRGGGLVINDLRSRADDENVYLKILPDLISVAKHHGAVLSIGASFRSGTIFDSLDAAQTAEIAFQIKLANQISKSGVGVIIESPGHARPASILRCAELLAGTDFPIMPLGPLPTDAAVGLDHIAAAIGATLMGMNRAAHILAAVTREEHTGGVPSIASTLEAVQCAQVAAHVIDLHLYGDDAVDARTSQIRADAKTCVSGKQTAGCSRCGSKCPLY